MYRDLFVAAPVRQRSGSLAWKAFLSKRPVGEKPIRRDASQCCNCGGVWTFASPSPRPSPLGRGRIVRQLSTNRSARIAGPSSENQPPRDLPSPLPKGEGQGEGKRGVPIRKRLSGSPRERSGTRCLAGSSCQFRFFLFQPVPSPHADRMELLSAEEIRRAVQCAIAEDVGGGDIKRWRLFRRRRAPRRS